MLGLCPCGQSNGNESPAEVNNAIGCQVTTRGQGGIGTLEMPKYAAQTMTWNLVQQGSTF